uniref:Uncharacterized protein n=1 Tax=Guillardia theta TaxID=55529 RepID=A0A7S4N4T9_GUITH|mmetsp:Transcript_1682/g.5100  ORF Transcript_1682/g.5100 Transcript_1682/m.5100 type:complete len:289 (+) Transcript_1682:372-1238(+)
MAQFNMHPSQAFMGQHYGALGEGWAMHARNQGTSRSKYKCGICGQPKKGHVCQAAQSGNLRSAASSSDAGSVNADRRKLLEKLQQRMGKQDSETHEADSKNFSDGIDDQESDDAMEDNDDGMGMLGLPQNPPSVLDWNNAHMSGLTAGVMPASPARPPVPLWSPQALPPDSVGMIWQPMITASPTISPGGNAPMMWGGNMPQPSPGQAPLHVPWSVLPPSPGMKIQTPNGGQMLPLWSQTPSASASTPGWGSLATPTWASTPNWAGQLWQATPAGGTHVMWGGSELGP